jgi:hypothetical protein
MIIGEECSRQRLRALGARMLLTILKDALFLMFDIAIIGCAVSFFYMCLFKPTDFVELKQKAGAPLYRLRGLPWRDFQAYRLRVNAIAYLLMAWLGVGLCLYGGLIRLFAWFPRFWVTEDGIWMAQGISALLAFMGSMALIEITMGTAHKLNDLKNELVKLKTTNTELTRSNYLLERKIGDIS